MLLRAARQGGQGDVLLLRQPGQAGWPGGRLVTETARPGRVARGTSCY